MSKDTNLKNCGLSENQTREQNTASVDTNNKIIKKQ